MLEGTFKECLAATLCNYKVPDKGFPQNVKFVTYLIGEVAVMRSSSRGTVSTGDS